MRNFFCGVILLLSSAWAKAQQTTWTLEDCITYGLENNLSVKQQQLQFESSTSTFKQSKLSRLPTVVGNASQSYRTGRSIDPFTNQFVTEGVNSSGYSINANWVLFNGLNTTNTIKQNKLLVEANNLDVEQIKRNISLNIAQAYLDVLTNQELLAVGAQQVAATRAQIERTEKLFKAGAVAEIQLINLQSQLANDEINVITAQNQLSFAKLNLMQQMNLPYQQNFEVAPVNVETITNDYDGQSPQQIYERAVNNQFDIKSADLRIRSSELAVEVARSNRYPTLALNAGINTAYSSAAPGQLFRPDGTTDTLSLPIGQVEGTDQRVLGRQVVPNGTLEKNDYFNQLDFNRSSFASLNLQIPIFNQGIIRNAITQAKITQKNQQYQSQVLRIQLRQTIEQAYNNLLTASINFEARKKQVEALQLTFSTTEVRFNAGAANSVDYNLAKINLDQAQANLVRSKYEYAFRIKVLDFYVNKPLF